MLGNIFSQYGYFAPLILRLALGVILIHHGWPKLFGPQPGLKGFSGWLGSVGFPVPMFWAAIVALLEVFGGIALILGFATRWVSLLVALQFVVILIFVKKGAAWKEKEFDLLILGAALALMLLGSGAYNAGAWLGSQF